MYWVTAKNAVVLVPRWRSLSFLLSPSLNRAFSRSAPLPLIRRSERIFCFKERKLYTKPTKKHRQPKITLQEKDYAHIFWWKEKMQLCKKPSSVVLVQRLTFSNLLGVDTTLKNGRVFAPYLRKFVLRFFDDILIYSHTWNDHIQHVNVVLGILRQHQLYAKMSKCNFGVKVVEYLGNLISADGVSTDPEKVRCMVEWPVPKNIKAYPRAEDGDSTAAKVDC